MQSLEHVRLSKNELDRREQITSSLRFASALYTALGYYGSVNWLSFVGTSPNRTENIQLQAKVRDLESCKESYAVVSLASFPGSPHVQKKKRRGIVKFFCLWGRALV